MDTQRQHSYQDCGSVRSDSLEGCATNLPPLSARYTCLVMYDEVNAITSPLVSTAKKLMKYLKQGLDDGLRHTQHMADTAT